MSEQPDGSFIEVDSRDAVFLEEDYTSQGEAQRDIDLYEAEETQEDTMIIDSQEDTVPPDPMNSGSPTPRVQPTPAGISAVVPSLRRSARLRYSIEGGESLLASSYDDIEPRTIGQALSSPASKEWKKALQNEMTSIGSNHIWDLVALPSGRKAIESKWVFKVKRSADGNTVRHKARIEAVGVTPSGSDDHDKTFSLKRIESTRLLLAIVVSLDLELHHLDVMTSFLSGEHREVTYMTQPEGFEVKGKKHLVCKLAKSIYGIEPTSKQWYHRFHQDIVSYGFTVADEEHCMYVKRLGGKLMILSLFVDDILLAGNDTGLLGTTIGWLTSRFSMKDIGEPSDILGTKIHRDRSKRLLGISQGKFIQEVLECFHMLDSKPTDNPVLYGEKLSCDMCPKTQEEKDKMTRIPYTTAVKCLEYIMLCTRPDLSFPVELISRFIENPGIRHWNAVKKVLRYLSATRDCVLCYRGSELRLVGYTDADWGGDLDTRKSTSGYVFMLGGGAITWRSKMQTCTALSTMEAEYVACSAAAQKCAWLRKTLINLGLMEGPITLCCDSMAAIAFAKDPKYHGRAKHIHRKYHLVREMIASTEIVLEYIPTGQMLADPMTKPLLRDVFVGHTRNLGLSKI